MLQNYIKIAWRNLLQHKTLSFINIAGLSIGIACFSLFILYAVNEFNYDRFHENADQIFRVYRWTAPMNGRTAEGDPNLPMPLGAAFKDEFPEVKEVVRFRQAWRKDLIRIDREAHQVAVTYADPQVFDVFTFPLKYGNPSKALENPKNIVLTEKIALQLFGEANPIGRILDLQIENNFESFTVSGVAEDLPPNSTIQFEMLASFEYLATATSFGRSSQNNWGRSAFQTLVQLREGSNLQNNPQTLLAFREKYYPDVEANLRQKEYWTKEGAPITYKLQQLQALHTDTSVYGGFTPNINPKNIWLLVAIAAAVLLIACINFTTIAIGRSARRAKEVGVRKVMGGQRGQLIQQFLAEAFLLSTISAGIGLALAQFLLPWFNELADKSLYFSLELYPEIPFLFAGVILAVTILAGAYPALSLSGFRPVQVLKSNIKLGGANWFTKSLVTSQFVLSIGLIASTVLIVQQLDFMRSKHPGFNKENVVIIDARTIEGKQILPLFQQQLAQNTAIEGIAGADMGIGADMGWSSYGFDYQGTIEKEAYEYSITSNFLDVMDLDLLAGRNFNPNITSDTINAILINETMAKDFGWTIDEAVGQELTGFYEGEQAEPIVIGVVKDFNYRSFHQEIQPQFFQQFPNQYIGKFFVRLQAGNPETALVELEKAWNTVVSGIPFQYSFLDDKLNNFYRSEARFGHIFSWASGIAIFLACLGLLGLAMLAAINRRKEIGIRRILGASLVGLIAALSKGFLKLVAIALLIATPLTWYFMSDWLQNFAYRIDIQIWVFLIVGLVAIVIAFLTVGFQSFKAALANPVEALRSE